MSRRSAGKRTSRRRATATSPSPAACFEAGDDDHTIAAALAAVRGFDTRARVVFSPERPPPRTPAPPTAAPFAGTRLGSTAGRSTTGTLAAYLDSLREAGRARATAAIVVAAVRHAGRDAGRSQPDGPLTRQAIESFRRAAAAAGASARRSLARGLIAEECDRVLTACCRPRRTGRGVERDGLAVRRGLVDGAVVALVFHGALRRGEVAALRWSDVDLSAGDDIVVVTVPGSKTNPAEDGAGVRQLVGGCMRRRSRRQPIRSSASGCTRSTAGSRPPAPRPALKDAGRRTATASDSRSSSPPAGPAPAMCSSPADGRMPARSPATRSASPAAEAP